MKLLLQKYKLRIDDWILNEFMDLSFDFRRRVYCMKDIFFFNISYAI